jgi:hypothetical protein
MTPALSPTLATCLKRQHGARDFDTRTRLMYVQLIEPGTLPDRSEELGRVIRDKLLPALREEPGFCGALHLVECDSGNAMTIVCWETEEQATRPYRKYGAPCTEALEAIAGVSSGCRRRLSVWEVNARA